MSVRGKTTPVKSRQKSTKRHLVKADLSVFELAKAKSALTLQIYASKEKIGTIEIGRGAIYWWGKNRQKSKRVSWTKFAEMMDKLAYGL